MWIACDFKDENCPCPDIPFILGCREDLPQALLSVGFGAASTSLIASMPLCCQSSRPRFRR